MTNKSINLDKIQPTIPKYVADYITWSRDQDNFSLKDLLSFNTQSQNNNTYKTKSMDRLASYIQANEDLIAMAWLNGYKLQDRNYIEVSYEQDWDTSPVMEMGLPIRFIGDNPDPITSYNYLAELHVIDTGKTLELKDALNRTFKSNEKVSIYEEFIEYYPEYNDELKTFEEVSAELTQELFEYSVTDTSDIKKMMEANGYQIGTVGRSQWTYYIMSDTMTNYNLPYDMWEGYNFYTLSLLDIDTNGKLLGYKETYHYLYIPNMLDLDDRITQAFGLSRDEVHLVKNNITQHLLDYDMVTMRTEVYYEPEQNTIEKG